MSNPLLADVDVLFGRNLEGTGFLKYANTARKLLGDIPLSHGGSAKLDDGGAVGNLSGKSDGSDRATPQHSSGGGNGTASPFGSSGDQAQSVQAPQSNPTGFDQQKFTQWLHFLGGKELVENFDRYQGRLVVRNMWSRSWSTWKDGRPEVHVDSSLNELEAALAFIKQCTTTGITSGLGEHFNFDRCVLIELDPAEF